MRSSVPALIVLLLFSQVAAVEFPLGTPSSEYILLTARELYGRKLLDNFEYAGGFSINGAGKSRIDSSLVSELNRFGSRLIPKEDSSFITSYVEVSAGGNAGERNDGRFGVFPGFRLDLNRNLSATIVYRIDNSLTDDPRYDGKSWNGWAGFAERATVNYSWDKLKLGFGLERISWGFGRYGNLMFSRQALPMTVLRIEYRTSLFEFQAFSGFLSPLHEEIIAPIDNPGYFTSQQRYVTAHSLSIKPLDGLSFSLREAVIYGGPGRRFEPAYAFPLIWYHGYQLNSGIDDNTSASFGFDYRYSGRVWVYGDLLIDDYQIDNMTGSDNEPNQLGYLAGFELYDLGLVGSSIRLEYARINNWVYNQPHPHNRFINRNFPLGFPDGPDNDRFDWEVSQWSYKGLRLAYYGSYQRVGEGRIDSDWDAPWLDAADYSEPFPTGIVQRKMVNGVNVTILPKMGFYGKMGIQLADIKNAGNFPENKSEWEFSLEIGYDLPQFGWGF